jgi:RNA polymerase sigma-70 factor (ECF subfamily)
MELDDLTDAQLVGRVDRKDEAALEALYDRYASAIMGLALRILGDRGAADEIVQETFWRAWTKAGRFSAERGSVLSWLFAIAHNLSIDVLRRNRMELTNLDLQSAGSTPDKEPAVDAQVSLTGQFQELKTILAELPPEQREVIELAYFGGLTRQDIAEKTGMPLGTIHTRARLGLQKLRTALLARDFNYE